MNLEVRYSVVGHREAAENGSSRTIDMSSSGLSFAADTPLSIGQTLDMSIDWPVRLDRDVQIQLVASGVVVWTSGTKTALRLQRHEFRTRRVEPKATSR